MGCSVWQESFSAISHTNHAVHESYTIFRYSFARQILAFCGKNNYKSLAIYVGCVGLILCCWIFTSLMWRGRLFAPFRGRCQNADHPWTIHLVSEENRNLLFYSRINAIFVRWNASSALMLRWKDLSISHIPDLVSLWYTLAKFHSANISIILLLIMVNGKICHTLSFIMFSGRNPRNAYHYLLKNILHMGVPPLTIIR